MVCKCGDRKSDQFGNDPSARVPALHALDSVISSDLRDARFFQRKVANVVRKIAHIRRRKVVQNAPGSRQSQIFLVAGSFKLVGGARGVAICVP